MGFRAGFSMFALLGFKKIRVVFLLFPPMAKRTLILLTAPFLVIRNKSVRFPVGAHLMRILKLMGLASVVLPIVSIQAYLSVVVIFSIGTPNCFEMVHIKIHIYDKLF